MAKLNTREATMGGPRRFVRDKKAAQDSFTGKLAVGRKLTVGKLTLPPPGLDQDRAASGAHPTHSEQ
jgi:hypothetical protein